MISENNLLFTQQTLVHVLSGLPLTVT
jgi:hypothetical protein